MNKISSYFKFTFLFFVFSCGIALGQTNCLAAHYKLDGNAADSSGNGKHGILHGTTSAFDRFGNANQARHFNGVSDYIDLPSAFDYNQRTLSLWMYVELYPNTGATTPGSYAFISDNPNMQYGATGLFVNNVSGVNQILHLLGGNANYYTNATTNIWYHAAIVLNASYIKYYLNGIAIDSIPRGTLNSSTVGHNTALIGVSRVLNRFFQGVIDDVRIYDCALNDSDILTLYNINSVGINSPINKSLVSIYPNPAGNSISFNNLGGFQGNYFLSIKNIQGQEIMYKKIRSSETNTIDISDLNNGIYSLSLIGSDCVFESKFVVLK